ncbi:MAG TPA: hypothetical protein VF399_08705 [bacterium]
MVVFFILSQLFLADSLYAHKCYDVAAVEYKRELFFYPQMRGDIKNRLPYAVSLVKSGNQACLEELENLCRDFPQLDSDVRVSIAKCYIKQGYYYTAADLLSPTAEHRLLGYTMLLDERYAEARDLFAVHGDTALAGEVERYISSPKKSVMKATLLSFVVPGLGQVYAGNVKRGIMDFTFTVGAAYLMYDAFHDKRYVDASLIFSFLFNRFYVGSISNAQRLALARNEQAKDKWVYDVNAKYFKDLDDEP